MKKPISIMIILMLHLLAGCGAKDEIVKYKITFNDSIFETEKTEYAAGEKVTVRYDIIATDTDYWFSSDDVEFKQDYDGGYVFTFVMPDHDVTLNVESRNSMEYDPIGQYTPESENDTIAVMMSVTNVAPTGLVVHFRQYDKRDTGDLIYGEGYSLERLNGDTWEPVPTIIEDWAFTDEGFTLPAQGEADMETDWSWLYGTLPAGTYRITKTFTDSNRKDPNVNIPVYPLKAQFIIVG